MKKNVYYFAIKGAAMLSDLKVNETAKGDDVFYELPPINEAYNMAYVSEDGYGVASTGDGTGQYAVAFVLANGEQHTPEQMLEILKKRRKPSTAEVPKEMSEEASYLYRILVDAYEYLGPGPITFNEFWRRRHEHLSAH